MARSRGSSALEAPRPLSPMMRFQRLVNRLARHTANVESAIPLPADIRADIESGLKKGYGSGVSAASDPTLLWIGGIRIRGQRRL
jgi:hypothetical protein